ncbi:hypothetical protein chiPu_0026956 [Chiloscyllium punctatum]|uniref:Uncharacterized protein n=1 Tax=Chiloscyllium punctatum TaxID=137246 RepID=A0A401TKT0_CHIPU|nr:hypothetical protein [Chiloscyllium punctatum]
MPHLPAAATVTAHASPAGRRYRHCACLICRPPLPLLRMPQLPAAGSLTAHALQAGRRERLRRMTPIPPLPAAGVFTAHDSTAGRRPHRSACLTCRPPACSPSL